MRIRHLFLHSGNSVYGVIMPSMTVQRWADAQEKFKGVTEIFSVVTIEAVRAIIDRKLSAEPDVDAVAMRQIAHITECVGTHRKDARFIRACEHELVPGFFHALPTRIHRIAPTLII